MKRFVWIGLMVGFSQGLFAQYSMGLVNGNYAGVSASLINPSALVNTKLRADINIFSARAFVDNNYLYFPSRKASLIKLVNGAYDYELFPKPYGTGNRMIYTYYNDKSLKNLYVNARIMGPSFEVAMQNHNFGLRTGVRMMSSTRRLPYDMANFSYYTMDFRPQQDHYFVRDNYDMSSMAWYEIMATYATVFNQGRNNLWSVGVSAGPLFGYGGAYVKGGDTRYIVYNEKILNVENLNAEFGMSLPVDYDNNVRDYYDPLVRGHGWGMDLGITWLFRNKPYQRRIPYDCYKKQFEQYDFKLGVSIIDIGWVNFTNNAQKHVFENVHNNWIRVDDFTYTNINTGLKTASEWFYGDSTASLKGTSFKIYLPTSLSVQFDYHVKSNWYVNGTAVIPVKYTSPMIENPYVLAVTPRYEGRFFGVNLPLILYDWNNPRIGLSIRIDGLTIGTDNLICFTSAKDFTGADFYVSYRILIRTEGRNPYSNRGACYNNWRTKINSMHKNAR
jgi:hypothetical protein